jgi:hypothetical protein
VYVVMNNLHGTHDHPRLLALLAGDQSA